MSGLAPPPRPPVRPLRVLVTGAGGLIGSELCGRLAENGHGVVALVHRTRQLLRNDGHVIEPAPWSGEPVSSGAVVAVQGDVTRPDSGLSPADARALASSLDIVVHAAAATGFQSAPALHRSVNVDGTRNILALLRRAAGTPPGLLHVSTAYVSGERSGVVPEEACDPRTAYANGYEATKAEAEALVLGSDLPAAIARPSIVVGRADTGAIGRFENIYAFLKLIVSGRIPVLPSRPGATLDLVPIDHVVEGIVDIVERFPGAAGRIFHLVSGDPVPLETLVRIDYPGFQVPRLVSPESFDPAAVMHGRMTSLFAAYLRRDPRFSSWNLRALSGRVCPPTGPRFLSRLIGFAAKAGFLVPDVT